MTTVSAELTPLSVFVLFLFPLPLFVCSGGVKISELVPPPQEHRSYFFFFLEALVGDYASLMA